jgi:hypothetical protein
MSITIIKAGDPVRCTRAMGTRGRLVEGTIYTVANFDGRHVKLEGVAGLYLPTRFSPVTQTKAGKRKAPFGQVRSVTVNMSDIHDVLTQYVQFGLGINATVEKIIDKFPEAVELVLKHEVA